MTSPKSTKAEARGSFGIVGGRWALSGADVPFKFLKSIHADSRSERCKVIFEQHPFHDPTDSRAATIERKLYIFNMICDLEKRGVTTIVLPCFLGHTFIDQLQENTSLTIIDMIEALVVHVRRCYPSARRIGMLTSDYMRELLRALFSEAGVRGAASTGCGRRRLRYLRGLWQRGDSQW